MINALFTTTSYSAAKKLLDYTAARQEAIQSNLSNIETPNYKRLDVAPRFSDQLRTAVKASDPTAIASISPQLSMDTKAVASRRDGNTVQLESELMHLSQNSLEHALETQLVSSRLVRLRTAITGRAG